MLSFQLNSEVEAEEILAVGWLYWQGPHYGLEFPLMVELVKKAFQVSRLLWHLAAAWELSFQL